MNSWLTPRMGTSQIPHLHPNHLIPTAVSVPEPGHERGSPGRNRTFVAIPDSKSGGPCQQTNRGTTRLRGLW